METEPLLTIHTGNRLERLLEGLAEVLSRPIDETTPAWRALRPEIVVVQSRGMARWVALELAKCMGVCANISFPFPNAFLKWLFETVDPAAGIPEAVFEPGVMTWAVMKRLGMEITDPQFSPLLHYIKDDTAGIKRYQLSRRIAWLFDQYQVFRPDMIAGWEAGETTQDPMDGWQPVLWRSISKDGNGRHRAYMREHLLKTIYQATAPLETLPERISVFGVSYLPPFFLELFQALSFHMEVHFFLLNPCQEFWADIRSERAVQKALLSKPSRTSSDDLHLETGNRLLSVMGAMGRDFFNQVYALEGRWRQYFETPDGSSVLHILQADMLNLTDADPAVQFRNRQTPDHSIQIHSCHSPMREVQVLHDNLLEMFQFDPELRPEEILVLSPDIDLYAPYVEAVFEPVSGKDPRIPFSIADRTLQRMSAAIRAFFSLLEMKISRLGAGRVMALLEQETIREKFGFTLGEFNTMIRWIRETGIRWGKDRLEMERLGLPGIEDHTWVAGFRRLLLGYALPGDNRQMFQSILPYDHVEGNGADVLDRFLLFFERVTAMVEMLSQSLSPGKWRETLQWMIETFIEDGEASSESVILLQQAMDAWVRDTLVVEGDGLGVEQSLGLEVVKAELEHRLSTAHKETGFLSGGVTFCSMLPLRAIPSKVIALLGMNMDAFPRKDPPSSFNLMTKAPRPGDRSSRNDDQYLFLETVISARKILYISYMGQSMADNTPVPPSVLVSELIDTVVEKYGKNLSEIITCHRLQPFSDAYFSEGGPLFSYSTENQDAARALQKPASIPDFVNIRLPEPEAGFRTLTIKDLIRFFHHPPRFFLKEWLGVEVTQTETTIEDQEPFTIDPLNGFQLGSEILDNLRSGEKPEGFFDLSRQKGRLPQGGPGLAAMGKILDTAESVWEKVRPLLKEPSPAEPVILNCRGFTLTGNIPERYEGCFVFCDYGNLDAKRLLRAWIYHVAYGIAGFGGEKRRTLLFCRDKDVVFHPVDNPGGILGDLLSVYWEGLQSPIRFYPKASFVAAKEILESGSFDSAREKVEAYWSRDPYAAIESQDPYNLQCFRLERLIDSSFFDTAVKVYGPILGSIHSISL